MSPSLIRFIFAWLVHLFTALGAVVGFYAIIAIEQASFREAFFLMALAVIIDASDGTLARAARVKEIIPRFDGDLLDNIVDYLNYVVIPCLFLLRADLLPPQDSLWLAALPLLASAYGFCQRDAKTADYFFLGFPSYWNIVVFYLAALKTPHWLNAFVILGLSILVFVPLKYLYPSRSPRFRASTNFLGMLWGAAILWLIFQWPEPSRGLVIASLFFPAYYTTLSFWLEIRGWVNKQSGE